MKRTLFAVLLATALAAPAAMAQTGAGAGASIGGVGAGANVGTNAGYNNGAGGANGSGAATANNNGANGGGANGMPSQRNTQAQAQGTGAILTIAPSGVREVQQALNRLGYAAGVVNGVWSRSTAQAMVNFQQAHGLEPTGNLNLSSIAALGLWGNLVGNPLGQSQNMANSAVPPGRGGGQGAGSVGMGGNGGAANASTSGANASTSGNEQKGSNFADRPLPSQRITNEGSQ